MPDRNEIAKWLASAIGAVQGIPAQTQAELAGPISDVLNAAPGERNAALNSAAGQIGGDALRGLGKVIAGPANPAKAIIQQEEAKLAKKQAAAAALGIDPETGLPSPAIPQPVPAPAPVDATMGAPVEISRSAGNAGNPPQKAVSPANSIQSDGSKGPYDQSPSMLPGTDPEEIAAAKRAADKQAEDAKYAAEEQEVKDAIAAGHNVKGPNGLQAFMTALVSPDGSLRREQMAAQQAAAGKPLQELMQRRELLSKMRADRGQEEERTRARSLSDPDSELTKASSTALRALGVPVPRGYTASMFNDMKAIAQLTGQQKHEAAQLIVQQGQAAEAARHNRAGERADNARIASEHEGRLIAAGAPEKAVQAAKLQQVEAYNKAQHVSDELNKLVDESGNFPLSSEARGRAAQLRHELATLAVQAKSKPGQVPRPNAVEEELHLIPEIGGAHSLIQSRDTTKNLVKSFVKGIGGEVGAEPAAPAGHPQANEAMQWANAHPNDPRAAAILQRLGGG